MRYPRIRHACDSTFRTAMMSPSSCVIGESRGPKPIDRSASVHVGVAELLAEGCVVVLGVVCGDELLAGGSGGDELALADATAAVVAGAAVVVETPQPASSTNPRTAAAPRPGMTFMP